jgi:ribosome assembly protein 3
MGKTTAAPAQASKKPATDAQVSAAFTDYYLRQATSDYADDLDRLRATSDFRDGEGQVQLLATALRQGTATFSAAEQRRVVTAAEENGTKK